MAEYQILVQEGNQRIDKYLSDCLPTLTRTKIQSLIKSGHITLLPDHQRVSVSDKSKVGEKYNVVVPEPLHSTAFSQVLDVVYEDDHLAVINKPAGLTVHGGVGTNNDTLVDLLLQSYGPENLSNRVMRPGIVHRLDKNTTGLMVIAKNDMVHAKLADAIMTRQLKRQYIAIVCGSLSKTTGTIDANIAPCPKDRRRMHIVKNAGKQAITHYQVLKTVKDKYSIVECTLETGRTHQIRVHMSYIGHPIVGDMTYGTTSNMIERQALHAYKLSFVHPVNAQNLSFQSELPSDIKRIANL